MFFLYDLKSCHLLAIIGEGDVRALINDPNDNALEHRSYHYDTAELDALEARGVNAGLIDILRRHLGNRDRTAVCWGRRQEDRLATPEELEEMLPADTP